MTHVSMKRKIPAYDTTDHFNALDNTGEDFSAFALYTKIAVPIENHVIPIDELLSCDDVIYAGLFRRRCGRQFSLY